ncbi:MAG: hypothetical protein ACTSPM_05885 [Candidatus Heimdallarchaeota archaeon]
MHHWTLISIEEGKAETTAELSLTMAWSDPLALSELDHESSFYPDMAIDSKGNIHVVWKDELYNYGEIFYRIFYPTNNSFSIIQMISNENSYYSSYAPKIAVDSSDTVHFIWSDSYGNSSLIYRSFDGAVFSEPIIIAENASCNDQYLAVNDQNDVFICWEQPNNDSRLNIFIRIYSSAQQTWSPIRQITNTSYYSSATDVAADKNNIFHLVWGESSAILETREIHYTYFEGEDFIQGNISVISPIDGLTSTTPKITVDSTNKIHFIWFDFEEFDIYYRNFELDNWSEVKLISGQGVSSNSAIFADSFNTIHITWRESRIIYYKQRTNTSQWSNTIQISKEELYAIELSIVADPIRGTIYIAMMEYFQENTWETYLITGTLITKDNMKYLLILLGIIPIIFIASIIYFSKKQKQ